MAKLTHIRERVHSPFFDTRASLPEVWGEWTVTSINNTWCIGRESTLGNVETKGPYADAATATRALALEVLAT